jgi:hypothetical protein
MKRTGITWLAILSFCLLAACCRRDACPLAGTWEQTGAMRMIAHSSYGEMDSLDVVEKVSCDVKGQDVLVTYKDGPTKGSPVRDTMIGPDVAKTEMGTLRRVKEN